MLQLYYSNRKGVSYETKEISTQSVSGLHRPRCRETTRTAYQRVRQNLETQGPRQTIHTKMDSSADLINL